MSKLNHSGDVSLERQIYSMCKEISSINLLEKSDLLDQLQNVLEQSLFTHVIIHPKKSKNRKFPQLERRDNILWIYYFHPPKDSAAILTDSIILQLSIAIVLSVCSDQFVDNLPADETICSFSERWPFHSNLSTQLYDAIRAKIM